LYPLIWIIVRVAVHIVLPGIFAWGWLRWLTDATPRTIPSSASLFGFLLANASALLAIATAIWALARPFPFYDPTRSLRILGIGSLLALLAICSSLVGIWRKNALRWIVLACGMAMLAFWIGAASGE
jgi:hypothetical protein